jgi:cardiolipin synthase (CMP-forming)
LSPGYSQSAIKAMTIPNLITILRIILAPVFVIYLINNNLTAAFIVFVVCTASDGVDGFVARVFNQKSKLGAYLDPLADKLLLVTAFVVLAVMSHLPAWLTVTVIARDVMIVLGVLTIHMNKLELHIRPTVLSKVNTCFQFLTVAAVLSKGLVSLSPALYLYLYYVTALFTVASGLHYIQYGLKVMSSNGNV